MKVYLQVAWNFKAFINFYKGRLDNRRPHEAYNEEDIFQLIDELMKKRDCRRQVEMRQHKTNHQQSLVWLSTACTVSFLYDVAGRAEDAFHLTWEKIKIIEDRAIVDLVPGKTASKR